MIASGIYFSFFLLLISSFSFGLCKLRRSTLTLNLEPDLFKIESALGRESTNRAAFGRISNKRQARSRPKSAGQVSDWRDRSQTPNTT